MSTNRLLILGIDGLDSELLEKWKDHLPNMGRLKAPKDGEAFSSIFPPDTTPAWATIYTGMSPSQHGVINFVNPADREGGYTPLEVSDELLRGNTFWDNVSKAGHKVCIVLPMIISPGWEVNGTILCRSTSPANAREPLTSFPPDRVDIYNPHAPTLNLVGGFYGQSQLGGLADFLKRRLEEEERLTMEMLEGEQWQLFFSYFSALDEVQHVFWPYCDPQHPAYPGPNEFETIILDFYKKADDILGRVLAACDPSDKVIVVSDHGQGPRPSLVANLNEWLRREGYLVPKQKGSTKAKNRLKSRVKNLLLGFVRRYGAGKVIMTASKHFPVWKKLLAPSSGIDWEKSRAYVSDLSAVKNYSYGGIRVLDTGNPAEKMRVIDEIISGLKELRRPDSQEPLVKLAARREDVYQGVHIDKYPEILIEFDERYGIGWDFDGELFNSKEDMVHLKPGTHRRETAVFLSHNIEADALDKVRDLRDIYPLVLRSFDL